MDILIDNKKVMLPKKEFKNLSVIMDEVNKILELDGRMLTELYVNGRVLTGNQVILGKDIKVIEVMTKSPKMIILTALQDMQDFIPRYFESMNIIKAEASLDDENQFLSSVFEIVGGLEWCNNVLFSIKENTALDFSDEEFDEILEDFKGSLDGIRDALDSRDLTTLNEMLEYDMSDILADIMQELNNYYEEVLKEEVRDNMYA